jgi:hypothetical protein
MPEILLLGVAVNNFFCARVLIMVMEMHFAKGLFTHVHELLS